MSSQKPLIVGIAGGSASGKTTFIHKLGELFPSVGELTVISQDHYYKPLSEQVRDAKGNINFDRPEGIDFDRLRKDVNQIAQGKQVQIAEYTFNNPAVFPKKITFHPASVILIEGLFIYNDPKLSNLFNLRLYVEASQQTAFRRRLSRDTSERGMTQKEVEYQWNEHVVPAYEEFLLPHRESMDMIIMNNLHFDESLQVIASHFRQIIHGNP